MSFKPRTRRRFLGDAAGIVGSAAVASQLGWLSGCGGEAKPDWSALDKRLRGRLIRPGAPSYGAIAPPLNHRYDAVQPGGIALCASAADVRASLRWAQDQQVPVAVRSGGHNYAGYSTGPGLVVNLGQMRDVEVDETKGTVTAQPGARNTMIYAGLEPHGVAISAGRCPTVAVGGLVLGGGIGFSSRKFGLTCDHLVEASVVTADGELLRCNERENPDLFWGLRGGGGGNFGISTSYTFETRPVDRVTLYDVEWDWRDAAAVFAAFQQVIESAPDELSARIGVGRPGNPRSGSGGPPTISALGQFFGSKRDLEALLEPALRVGRITKRRIERRTFWRAKDYFFQTVPRDRFAVKSVFLDGPLSGAGVEALLRVLERWPGSTNADGAGAALFASGGAINKVPADATAYVHRNRFAILATETTWTAADSEASVKANIDWLDGLADALAPHVTRSAYQNFIDRSQPDWQRAYYGANLERLVEVKRRYDPENLFSFEQSIPLSA